MRNNRLDSAATRRMLAQEDNRAVVSGMASKVSDIATAKYRRSESGETLVWDTFTKVWRTL